MIKVSFYIIVVLVITTIVLNLMLLIDTELIGYFRWVNTFTGFSLVSTVLLTWFTRRYTLTNAKPITFIRFSAKIKKTKGLFDQPEPRGILIIYKMAYAEGSPGDKSN